MSRWPRRRPALNLLVAVLGYGLTFYAWSLTGPVGHAPQLWSSLHTSAVSVAVFTGLIVGSLGRIPIGLLTDRHGARVVLPVIGVITAVAVLLLAALGPGPVLLAVTIPLGVGGTVFAVGAAVVIRSYPAALRGSRLSLFGAGMGLASAGGVISQVVVTVDRRTTLPLLALGLLGHAALAALVLRDRPGRRDSPRVVAELLKLPAMRHLCVWYALAFGGLAAYGVYLPAYLHRAHQLPVGPAALYTTLGLAVAAACRPLGGWLCRRENPVTLLRTTFAGAAMAVLGLALHPGLPTAGALIGVAVASLGTASGIVQALIGAIAPPERAGTVAGTVGAIGGLAGVLPPLLLATTHGVSGTYSVGLTLLAALALATAARLHRQRRSITACLAFPATGTPDPGATTVLVAPDAHSPGDVARIVAALADAATRHELVVVASGIDAHLLVAGLRIHLPRHRIIGVTVDASPHPHELALIAELLNDGALPVVAPATAHTEPVARLLAAELGTNQVRELARSLP